MLPKKVTLEGARKVAGLEGAKLEGASEGGGLPKKRVLPKVAGLEGASKEG